LPWNRLGALLEKRKDYKGALEAYNQSLKVEWNQPPTIEAKARMETLLNQK
jgi:Flp pilus assembly protein TadD